MTGTRLRLGSAEPRTASLAANSQFFQRLDTERTLHRNTLDATRTAHDNGSERRGAAFRFQRQFPTTEAALQRVSPMDPLPVGEIIYMSVVAREDESRGDQVFVTVGTTSTSRQAIEFLVGLEGIAIRTRVEFGESPYPDTVDPVLGIRCGRQAKEIDAGKRVRKPAFVDYRRIVDVPRVDPGDDERLVFDCDHRSDPVRGDELGTPHRTEFARPRTSWATGATAPGGWRRSHPFVPTVSREKVSTRHRHRGDSRACPSSCRLRRCQSSSAVKAAGFPAWAHTPDLARPPLSHATK